MKSRRSDEIDREIMVITAILRDIIPVLHELKLKHYGSADLSWKNRVMDDLTNVLKHIQDRRYPK